MIWALSSQNKEVEIHLWLPKRTYPQKVNILKFFKLLKQLKPLRSERYFQD